MLHHSWSGDLLSAAFYYLPKGVKADVLSFWAPQQNGVVQNDFLCIGRTAKSPVLAHTFLELRPRREECVLELRQFHRVHAAAECDRCRVADQAGADPEEPGRRGRPARPVRGQSGAAAAEHRRRARLGRRLGEVQGGLMQATVDMARPRRAWRRLADDLLPGRVLRGRLRSRSATRTRSRNRCRSGIRCTGTSGTRSTS